MLRSEIREWLQSKRCALWADYSLVAEDSLEQAVDWWMKELADYQMFQMDRRQQAFETQFGAWDVTGHAV